jgi:hypothetical protein
MDAYFLLWRSDMEQESQIISAETEAQEETPHQTLNTAEAGIGMCSFEGTAAAAKEQQQAVRIGRCRASITAESSIDIKDALEANAFKDWVAMLKNQNHLEVL